MPLDDCLSDPELFIRLRQEMADRRDTAVTEVDVHAWHARLRDCTRGAIDDPAQIGAPLRELRRYLCSLAVNARMFGLARELLENARPPEPVPPPTDALPPADLAPADPTPVELAATTPDERVRWLTLQAMIFEGTGARQAALELYTAAGEDYLRQEVRQAGRFPALTNAVQAAYELGEPRRGARLLEQAETLAQANTDQPGVMFNLALARMFPPAYASDIDGFAVRLAEATQIMASVQPEGLPVLVRFAALAYLQMGAPERARAMLPPLPPDDAPRGVLSSDTMVRLQVHMAQGAPGSTRPDPALVARGLWLMGCPESVTEDWALSATLSAALFVQGEIGAATVLATVFLRDLDSAIETLPRADGLGMARRAQNLTILETLAGVLTSAGYLQAANDIASLHHALLCGAPVPRGAYADWAPSKALGEIVDRAREVQSEARAGRLPQTALADFLRAQTLAPSEPEAPAAIPPDALRLAYLVRDGALICLAQGPWGERVAPVQMSLPEIAARVQALQGDLRRGAAATEDRAALGQALLDPIADLLAGVSALEIAAHGAVAALPFAALLHRAAPLGETHRLTIRTGRAPRLSDPVRPGPPLHVAFALGTGHDALSAPQAEAQAILALHGQTGTALTEFNRPSLAAVLIRPPRILHISAHFRMDEHDPARSALIGADGEAVALSQLFNRSVDLRGTDLVFLAGCDSAGAQGQDSFAAQLVALGARHVIAALWPVDDAATQALAVATHRHLAAGAAPAQALSAAQDELRADPRFAAPRHWAAFQCYCG
ncbi:CHAT domain-containing protein [Paenirhodobacter sp. CAU 1674]|uniref:CHAT domain-containing protein n=1 Tax=Paenirhodobacter sp. CAU 1674 TaxID=3032596 RepID=UPI0023DBB5B0|nr:CHAT domain-containing protein [Paenirhodobacter sp. CAU 1674]MDF2142923.1 CHAT domain-containing protein [Paenirhodobacter sp. CAU 1674]